LFEGEPLAFCLADAEIAVKLMRAHAFFAGRE
jgi:hypothetical protein